jgi:hypothetical protein
MDTNQQQHLERLQAHDQLTKFLHLLATRSPDLKEPFKAALTILMYDNANINVLLTESEMEKIRSAFLLLKNWQKTQLDWFNAEEAQVNWLVGK